MVKLSIITPSYNSGPFLERTIRSVLDQEFTDFEHIVVESSPVKPKDTIAKYTHVQWILNENCSQSQALNIGFHKAQGDYIGWINSDDLYRPGAFRRAIAFLDAHPETDLVYSDCEFIDPEDQSLGIWKTGPFSYFRNLNYYQMVPQMTIFFRRTVFDRAGYLDENLHYTMDYDFLIRVSKNCKLTYLPGPALASFRLHAVSKTVSQRAKFEPEVALVKRRYGAVMPHEIAKAVQSAIGLVKKRL
jgi:glycosyltransferase involved in cell wall biosynthesis